MKKLKTVVLNALLITILSAIFAAMASMIQGMDLETRPKSNMQSLRMAFLWIPLIVVPCLEELSFRLPMKGRVGYIILALMALFTSLLVLIDARSELVFVSPIAYAGVFIVVIVFWLIVEKGVISYLRKEIYSDVRIGYTISVIPFCAIHVPKILGIFSNPFAICVSLIPLILIGLILGKVRLRDGLIYTILIHIVSDLLVILVF